MPGRAMLLLSVRVMCCEVCVVGYGMGEAAFFAFIVGGMSSRGGLGDGIMYMTAPPVAPLKPARRLLE